MLALPVIDALRALLPVGTGVTADDTGSQPAKALPARLYIWPLRVGAQQLADEPQGRVADTFLRIGLLYTLGAKGEPRVIKRERDLSERLDTAAQNLIAAIYANRRTALWWDAFVESIIYDAVRTEEVRGHGLNVTLRINTPPGIGG